MAQVWDCHINYQVLKKSQGILDGGLVFFAILPKDTEVKSQNLQRPTAKKLLYCLQDTQAL